MLLPLCQLDQVFDALFHFFKILKVLIEFLHMDCTDIRFQIAVDNILEILFKKAEWAINCAPDTAGRKNPKTGGYQPKDYKAKA